MALAHTLTMIAQAADLLQQGDDAFAAIERLLLNVGGAPPAPPQQLSGPVGSGPPPPADASASGNGLASSGTAGSSGDLQGAANAGKGSSLALAEMDGAGSPTAVSAAVSEGFAAAREGGDGGGGGGGGGGRAADVAVRQHLLQLLHADRASLKHQVRACIT